MRIGPAARWLEVGGGREEVWWLSGMGEWDVCVSRERDFEDSDSVDAGVVGA